MKGILKLFISRKLYKVTTTFSLITEQFMDLMSVNLSVKTLHSLKRRGERVGQPGSENIIFYTEA